MTIYDHLASEQDIRQMKENLEDTFKEWAVDDPSVGIWGMSEGERRIADAIMKTFEETPAPNIAGAVVDETHRYRLASGVTLTKEDMDEVRQIIYLEDDISDVNVRIDSGIYEDELFGEISTSIIEEIAKRKAYYERQAGQPWVDATDSAVDEWVKSHYSWILKVFRNVYITTVNVDISTDDFESDPTLFRNKDLAKSLLSKEEFAVWQMVVSAADKED